MLLVAEPRGLHLVPRVIRRHLDPFPDSSALCFCMATNSFFFFLFCISWVGGCIWLCIVNYMDCVILTCLIVSTLFLPICTCAVLSLWANLKNTNFHFNFSLTALLENASTLCIILFFIFIFIITIYLSFTLTKLKSLFFNYPTISI